jgi:transcriptional regulator with XRE-family HTH domain
MTGNEIRRLRELLGMPVPQFAQLFGVHVATAYRWETAGAQNVSLDPLHAALFARLQQSVDARPAQTQRTDWGKQLVTGVLIGGTLAGLAILLAELLPANPPVARAKKQGRSRRQG